MSKTLRRVDVVVVGAGFSGLQSAFQVHSAGFTCLVVEALDRIGGKSYTKPLASGKGHVDLGCTWVNGTSQTRMSALIKKYGLELVPQQVDGLVVYQDAQGQNHMSPHGESGTSLPHEQVVQTAKIFALIESEAAKFNPDTPGRFLDPNNPPTSEDCSLDEWLRAHGAQPGDFAYLVPRIFCAGMFGQEPTEISVYLYLEMVRTCGDFHTPHLDTPGGAQSLKIRTGTSSIVHCMAKT